MTPTIPPPSALIPHTSPPEEVSDLPAWRERMRTRHSALTEEQQRSLSERRATRERLRRLAQRGAQTERMSQVSRAAFLGSCMSYEAASAPTRQAAREEAQPSNSMALISSFGQAAMPQTSAQARRRTVAATEAMETLQSASRASCLEEGDAAIDQALNQLSVAGYSFANADEGVGAEAASQVADESLEHLLGSLKREPSSDEDRAARFALYERHAETVSLVRTSLLEFWDSARGEMTDPAPRAAVDQQVAMIDDRANLEMYENPHYWFVYSMAKATAKNETSIQKVLKAIRSKLQLLGEHDQTCPICLETISSEETENVALGCAHKLHADCWRHWSAHCVSVRKTPFCPTCRNEDFLEEILDP